MLVFRTLCLIFVIFGFLALANARDEGKVSATGPLGAEKKKESVAELSAKEVKLICKKCIGRGCFPDGKPSISAACATKWKCPEVNCKPFQCSQCVRAGCFNTVVAPDVSSKCRKWGCNTAKRFCLKTTCKKCIAANCYNGKSDPLKCQRMGCIGLPCIKNPCEGASDYSACERKQCLRCHRKGCLSGNGDLRLCNKWKCDILQKCDKYLCQECHDQKCSDNGVGRPICESLGCKHLACPHAIDPCADCRKYKCFTDTDKKEEKCKSLMCDESLCPNPCDLCQEESCFTYGKESETCDKLECDDCFRDCTKCQDPQCEEKPQDCEKLNCDYCPPRCEQCEQCIVSGGTQDDCMDLCKSCPFPAEVCKTCGEKGCFANKKEPGCDSWHCGYCYHHENLEG